MKQIISTVLFVAMFVVVGLAIYLYVDKTATGLAILLSHLPR